MMVETLFFAIPYRFSEISPIGKPLAAPVIDISGSPGYSVTVLVPAPTSPTPISARSTPAPTRAPSPPPPILSQKLLTVHDVTVLFLASLRRSAEDFLGRAIDGAVLPVPCSWGSAQLQALRRAAFDAGIRVIQFIPEAGAALIGYEGSTSPGNVDQTTLVLDLGANSLTLSLLSLKHSLVHSLGTLNAADFGGTTIDSTLISHFGKEFTKKTKIPITAADTRSEAKFRLAVEHTKRTLSASAGPASCSVESLKDGVDFSGSINRLRFDLLLAPFYGRVIGHIVELLDRASVQKEQIQEVLLIGGSAGLTGLADKLEAFFGEESGPTIRGDVDPSEALVKGAVLQAKLLVEIPTEDPLYALVAEDDHGFRSVNATSRPIGLVFPGDENKDTIPLIVIPSETPLPARRIVRFGVRNANGAAYFEVWEGVEVVKGIVGESVKSKDIQTEGSEDGDEDGEDELREVTVEKKLLIKALKVDIQGEKVEVRVDVGDQGVVKVGAREAGKKEWVWAT